MDDPCDPIDFTPAPSASARHDGWTADRQRTFIAALADHGCVAAAARAAGMTPQSARRLRKRSGANDFARAWDIAADQGRMRSWFDAARIGRDGWFEPVVRRGRVTGWRRRHSDRLLVAALVNPPHRFGPAKGS